MYAKVLPSVHYHLKGFLYHLLKSCNVFVHDFQFLNLTVNTKASTFKQGSDEHSSAYEAPEADLLRFHSHAAYYNVKIDVVL